MITTCDHDPVETAQDAYHRMLRDELGPRLAALGFTTTNPATEHTEYALPIPGHYALLSPHEYWANTPYNFQFTINVLLTTHTEWATYRTTLSSNPPAPTGFGLTTQNTAPGEHPHPDTHYGPGGPWTERLGTLMGTGDKWWYISPRRPTDPIAKDVTATIQQWALPPMLKRAGL